MFGGTINTVNHQYMHVISLGCFCSTALEMARIGLRDHSYPFDWLLSDWKGVENAIKANFPDFLNPDFLYQSKKYPAVYKNINQGFTFAHDFNKYIPLNEQIANVQEKYKRRIDRFYQSIQEPTLFIRYIDTNCVWGGEIQYLEQNLNEIQNLIKSFNLNNDILFICNDDYKSDILDVFYVKKDENDTVARHFLDKNHSLFSCLSNISLPNKDKNTEFYLLKKKNQSENTISNNFHRAWKKIFCNVYEHHKKY